jgi:hypothetical protein
MNELNFDEIQSFVSEFRGTKKEELTPETTLYWDLRIYGDDAIEFMEAFFNRYEIDFTDFYITKYFRQEGHSIVDLYYSLFKPEKLKFPPITLQHLLEVAKAKKWFEVSGVPL